MSVAPLPATRHTTADVAAASELLSALASPLRLSIVALLDEHGSRCVHELVDALGVPQPLVSQHLRVLRGARLVVGDRRHREVHYRLVDNHVGHIVRDAIEHAAHDDAPAADTVGETAHDQDHTHATAPAGPRRATIG
ncbi:metalloregulator ArsR/SmtB family transcription factor [Modestobacter sp. Leaf380]|uniref:ArsR/SmtB family transcription factor n=1 Tax=Modestobacter sp. Leaf380 TaxID=1736356 RepID=UPI0009EB7343|nr:metalloregulator ArsR/SmtB family transcription factor [Modestobacter sp. Leaf380]